MTERRSGAPRPLNQPRVRTSAITRRSSYSCHFLSGCNGLTDWTCRRRNPSRRPRKRPTRRVTKRPKPRTPRRKRRRVRRVRRVRKTRKKTRRTRRMTKRKLSIPRIPSRKVRENSPLRHRETPHGQAHTFATRMPLPMVSTDNTIPFSSD